MEEEGWPVRWNGPEMRLISLLVMRYSLQSDTLHGSRENHMEYYVFNTWTWTQNSQFSIVRVYWGFSLFSFFFIIIFIFRVLRRRRMGVRWADQNKKKWQWKHQSNFEKSHHEKSWNTSKGLSEHTFVNILLLSLSLTKLTPHSPRESWQNHVNTYCIM